MIFVIETRRLVATEKRQYEPVKTDPEKEKEFRSRILAKIVEKNTTCLSAVMHKASIQDSEDVSASSLPAAIFLEDWVVAKTKNLDCSVEGKCKHIMAQLPSLSKDDISSIADVMKTRSGSSVWQRARVGRITASNFGRVKSKVCHL